MLDIKKLRNTSEEIEKKLKTKIPDIQLAPILELDREVRALKTEFEELKAKQNTASKEIGKLKRDGKDASSIMEEMGAIRTEITRLHDAIVQKEPHLKDLLAHLPNEPMDEIPVGLNPEENVCIKTVGAKREFDFKFKNHLELNENLHLFDFKRSAKITGSSWPVYTDKGARLEWALINYMLDTHRKNGFSQIIPPLLVKEETMYGSAQLPKFKDQAFRLEDHDHPYYLIPTAEVPLNGLHQHEVLDDLPKKYTAYTPCFRREAGAAGKNERGLIRTHQFNKVELFSICEPDKSDDIFESMLQSAEEVLTGLGLHYKSMLLVTGDMSFAAAKTIDIEAWLPGQDRYYEVSSVSNCTDFQARRSGIKYKGDDGKSHFAHTLNGSGLATSRLMVALLENNQREDGSVEIPKVLHRYLDDLSELAPQELVRK